ncbi:hypothetical protein GHT06_014940 [Daphnia sinensis]|uniref:Uncharacterized protein n=1 Tax=Daphnia sinensis TaxID=1820382 RepID=A0AAD5KSL6_9CRUS|nr:hypothetical protein GHT06_014940 [Daphnia sinensis]
MTLSNVTCSCREIRSRDERRTSHLISRRLDGGYLLSRLNRPALVHRVAVICPSASDRIGKKKKTAVRAAPPIRYRIGSKVFMDGT